MDETVERGKSLTVGFGFNATMANTRDNRPIGSTDELLAIEKETKQRVYFHGKLEYSDGVQTYWLNYCKLLTEGMGWQTCAETILP